MQWRHQITTTPHQIIVTTTMKHNISSTINNLNTIILSQLRMPTNNQIRSINSRRITVPTHNMGISNTLISQHTPILDCYLIYNSAAILAL